MECLNQGIIRQNFSTQGLIIRKKLNTIVGLKDDLDGWHTDSQSITNIILDFYSKLFKLGNLATYDMQLTLDYVPSRVTSNMNNILISSFTPIEVMQAVKDMSYDKSLSLDGLSTMLYQNYWSAIGDSVITVVLDFLNRVVDLDFINSTLIV